jgi:hypothetical protein
MLYKVVAGKFFLVALIVLQRVRSLHATSDAGSLIGWITLKIENLG